MLKTLKAEVVLEEEAVDKDVVAKLIVKTKISKPETKWERLW